MFHDATVCQALPQALKTHSAELLCGGLSQGPRSHSLPGLLSCVETLDLAEVGGTVEDEGSKRGCDIQLAPQSSVDASVLCSLEAILSSLKLWPCPPDSILPNLRQDKEDPSMSSSWDGKRVSDCRGTRWQAADSVY